MQKRTTMGRGRRVVTTLSSLVWLGLVATIPCVALAADFTGVWLATSPRSANGANRPELTPRAQADLDAFDPLDDPVIRCVPPGFPRSGLIIYPFEIVQTEKMLVFLYEVFAAQEALAEWTPETSQYHPTAVPSTSLPIGQKRRRGPVPPAGPPAD